MKNPMAKTRSKDNPYEIWSNGEWTWRVLKKWQANDNKPFARWFCFVTSPLCPDGEFGDCYAEDIMNIAQKVESESQT